ncbi:MAG: sigma-70 family RNA polymerase sigma factor [Anaerolineales bacterium]|nr:sigma-70 family RNA polymerase sigma factor [Anaerolineales bacterium]
MQDNESTWLIRAQKGDPEAFGSLIEAYQKPVYNLCYRMLNDANDAEDAAQETFLRAYKNLRRYDNSRPFPTWLLSIAAHYCIDQIRKRRMTIVSVEELPYPDLPDGEPGPEAALSRGEEQRRIQRLLDTLSPQDRAAVVMYYWYDFSYEEISQALSLTLSAVKSRLHRARRELVQEWANAPSPALVVERTRHESPAF